MPKGKVIVSVYVSRDGFIADKNGQTQKLERKIDDIAGARQLWIPVDTHNIIVGKNGYLQQRGILEQLAKVVDGIYVLSRENVPLPNDKFHIVNGSLLNLVHQLQHKGNIWIYGGQEVINDCLSHDLEDEIDMLTVPINLQAGLPLFNKLLQAPNVELEEINELGPLTYSVWKRSKGEN